MEKTTRRGFIKASAALAAGAALPSVANAGIVNPSSIKWDMEADVVVLGSGFGGLCAAIEAHDAGSKVIMLEKGEEEYVGGNSKVSGNMWWAPTNAKDGATYIKAMMKGTTSDEICDWMAEQLLTVNPYLEKFGIKATPFFTFNPEYPTLPGSDAVKTFCNNGKAMNGTAYYPVYEALKSRKIQLLFETPGEELIQDQTGAVIGVIASQKGKKINIKAKKGVVIGTGGFESDIEMQKSFLPAYPEYGRGTHLNTGDGIRMASKAGAMLWHMTPFMGQYTSGALMVDDKWPAIAQNPRTNAWLWVNKLGKRFMNERREARHGLGHSEYITFFDGEHIDFINLPCYVITDKGFDQAPIASTMFGGYAWYTKYKWSKDNSAEVEKGWIYKANTIAELCQKMGLPADEVAKSVSRYNGFCKAGKDEDFERPGELVAVENGPFYGYVLWPFAFNTQGGPKRNMKCEIVDAYDRPIPRLYGVGECGSFWGKVYNGGGNNSEAIFTGRIAGTNAAALKAWS